MNFLKKPSTKQQILQVPIEEIKANPNQPRKLFHTEELQSLANSISELGILQPLTLRQIEGGYELIAGERRLRAAQQAGYTHVPSIIMDVPPQTSSLLALVENIQRQNLDHFEEAEAIAKLISEYGLSQDEVSKQLGKSQSTVANLLRLLRLSEPVVEALRAGACTQRHARALLKLSESQQQLEAIRLIVENQLNVAQTEELVEQLLNPQQEQEKPVAVKKRQKIILKDVQIFLNTVEESLAFMKTAGFHAECQKAESEEEICLTIKIPRKPQQNVSRETFCEKG